MRILGDWGPTDTLGLSIVCYLAAHDGEHSTVVANVFTDVLRESIADFEKFEAMVEATIDLDATENHEYFIRDEYSPELKEIREQMNEEQEKVPTIAQVGLSWCTYTRTYAHTETQTQDTDALCLSHRQQHVRFSYTNSSTLGRTST